MEIDSINKTTIHSNIDKIVEQLKCIINGKNAYYASIPITSGERFIKWYSEMGRKLKDKGEDYYREAHYRSVIQINIEQAINKTELIRKKIDKILIDPTQLEFNEWEQDEYRYYWGKVIEKYVAKAIFFNGWEYSNGCSFEFIKAISCNIECLNENLKPISIEKAIFSLENSIIRLANNSLDTKYIEKVLANLKHKDKSLECSNYRQGQLPILFRTTSSISDEAIACKDEMLDKLAWQGNVAQFISFRPSDRGGIVQKYCRVSGFEPNHLYKTPQQAIRYLIENSSERKINIRSYKPNNPKGFPFFYGLSDVDEALKKIHQLINSGLYIIVNETVDIDDGGVSGVLMNNIIEFSPGDTPKCVEKPGVCRLNRLFGIELLQTVYGFRPKISFSPEYRIEFSIHPNRRGFLRDHTIIWEIENVGNIESKFEINWPNNFSRFIGDKVFGLLIADALNIPVPKTYAISKKIAPFSFGQHTGTDENWLRTCPAIPEPGYYPTVFGWQDPFDLVNNINTIADDSQEFSPIMSILSQEGVEPIWSGGLVPIKDNENPIIEGVKGRGDKFMIGSGNEPLPNNVLDSVFELYRNAHSKIGPVSLEWVYDGKMTWCVQMHRNKYGQYGTDTIVPGTEDTLRYIEFDTKMGLNALRDLLRKVDKSSDGIVLVGDVGITSHFGDLLRSAQIPSKVKRPN